MQDHDTLDPIEAFVQALQIEAGLSKNTQLAYANDLKQFQEHLHPRVLVNANEVDINRYFAHRHGDTKATTANRRLSVFKRFFRWAVREQLSKNNPTNRLDGAFQPMRIPKALSEHQVEAILLAPDIATPLGIRDRAMLEVMYGSGARVT